MGKFWGGALAQKLLYLRKVFSFKGIFMQAVAFETEIKNDVIHIPEEYYGKIPYKATITIVYDDIIQSKEQELYGKRT